MRMNKESYARYRARLELSRNIINKMDIGESVLIVQEIMTDYQKLLDFCNSKGTVEEFCVECGVDKNIGDISEQEEIIGHGESMRVLTQIKEIVAYQFGEEEKNDK